MIELGSGDYHKKNSTKSRERLKCSSPQQDVETCAKFKHGRIIRKELKRLSSLTLFLSLEGNSYSGQKFKICANILHLERTMAVCSKENHANHKF